MKIKPRKKRPPRRFYESCNVIEQFEHGQKVGAILGDGDWEHEQLQVTAFEYREEQRK